jgi:hypothetical protein
MDLLQSWLMIGIPGLVVVAGLLVGRSATRAAFAYLTLAVLVTFFLTVPRDRISAAVIGLFAVVLVANGRGTHTDDDMPEHHENRKRFTTTPSHS